MPVAELPASRTDGRERRRTDRGDRSSFGSWPSGARSVGGRNGVASNRGAGTRGSDTHTAVAPGRTRVRAGALAAFAIPAVAVVTLAARSLLELPGRADGSGRTEAKVNKASDAPQQHAGDEP